MQTALFVARVIHNDLALGNASSWQWWTAITRADYKDGLVYLDDGNNNGSLSSEYCKLDGYARDSKLMWMLGNYSFFVRPGMKRIAVDTGNSDPAKAGTDVMVSAYKDDKTKKLVVVAINEGSNERTYKLNIDVKLKNQSMTPYTTSETSNLGKGADTAVDKMIIPAKSVVTFVGELE